MAVCYRHPSRETGVSCSSCGRPICPDCMTPTPVGMRCPECARDRTKVKTIRTRPDGAGRHPGADRDQRARVPGRDRDRRAAGRWRRRRRHRLRQGRAVRAAHRPEPRVLAAGDRRASCTTGSSTSCSTWCSCTSWGRCSSRRSGALNFAAVYFASLLAGSFGALLFQPASPTVGASERVLRGARGADRRRPLPRDLDLAERPRPDAGDQPRVLAQRQRDLDRRPPRRPRRRG